MTAAEPVVLSAQDSAFVRQTLAADAVFAQAREAGGPGYQALAEAALAVPAAAGQGPLQRLPRSRLHRFREPVRSTS